MGLSLCIDIARFLGVFSDGPTAPPCREGALPRLVEKDESSRALRPNGQGFGIGRQPANADEGARPVKVALRRRVGAAAKGGAVLSADSRRPCYRRIIPSSRAALRALPMAAGFKDFVFCAHWRPGERRTHQRFRPPDCAVRPRGLNHLQDGAVGVAQLLRRQAQVEKPMAPRVDQLNG
jgi:hypothetical protein